MNPRKTILLDCDGPLASFSAGFLGLVEEVTGFSFGEAVVTEWSITKSPFFLALAKDLGRDPKELAAECWKRASRIGFCASLPPVAGAKEAVAEIRSFANVEVVTSPLGSSPTWMPERVEWLGRHFGFEAEDVHFVSKKFRVHGDLLVDDKPSHIHEWLGAPNVAEAGAQALLWSAGYNQDVAMPPRSHRVASWPEVVAFARGFAE